MDLRVCYVVNSVSETSVPATIATALVDYEGIEVDILAWFDSSSFEGVDRVGVTCLNAPRSSLGVNRRIAKAAREQIRGYDVIQAHHNHSGSFAKIIGRRLGLSMVSREGNIREGFTQKGRIINGLTNGIVDRVVPNSQAVYNSFTRWERFLVNEDDVRIIPNGVDLDRIEHAKSIGQDIFETFNIPQESIVVGTAAVLSDQKAIDTLIRGVGLAREQTEQRIDLLIAGDGSQRSDLERLVSNLDLGNRVHFAGMVDRDRIYRILSEIDIYAMPSRWEGFANAAVEALGAENACLFSDIDPFIIPYRDVAIFHRVDDPVDLANRLVELSENPELRGECAQLGRELVEEKYTLEYVARQYTDLYSEIV